MSSLSSRFRALEQPTRAISVTFFPKKPFHQRHSRRSGWIALRGCYRAVTTIRRSQGDAVVVLPDNGAVRSALDGASEQFEEKCGGVMPPRLEADTKGDVYAYSAESRGLLGMPGWHQPEDLDPWARDVVRRLGQLRSAMQACAPGLSYLAHLHDHELLLRNGLRPTRYVADFHPLPDWRDAGKAAAARLDAAAAALYGDVRLYGKLAATQAVLEEVLAGDRGAVASKNFSSEGLEPYVTSFEVTDESRNNLGAKIVKELQRHPSLRVAGLGQWLQLCHVIRPLFRCHLHQRGTAADVSYDTCERVYDRDDLNPKELSSVDLAALQVAVGQCAQALRRLAAGRPPLAPRLVVHPAQLQLLRPWLPAGPDGSAAVEWLSRRQWRDLYGKRASAGGDGSGVTVIAGDENRVAGEDVEGADGGRGSSGSSSRRLLRLYDGAEPLDLDGLLLDATDEALELMTTCAAPTPSGSTGAHVSVGAGDCAGSGERSGRVAGGGASAGAGGGRMNGAGDVETMEDEEAENAPLVAVVDLTPEVSGRLLQLHPNEGVRWQVYHSGPLRQAQVLLEVLEHLTALRRQLAEALGAGSWAELVLLGGGWAGGGGGGAAAGSTLGSSAAVVRMLRELGAGLRMYGDRELQAIQRDVRRGRSGTALPADADPLDPWNLSYVLQSLAQVQAASRYDNSWSMSYSDYFSPLGLLKGSDALCRTMFGIGLIGPLELAPGEATGWVAEASFLHTAAAGCGVQHTACGAGGDGGAEGASRSREAGVRGLPREASVGRGVEERRGGSVAGSGGSGGGVGNDVVLKAAVVCCRTNRDLGVLYFHLHGNLSEYPFTSLLHHLPASGEGEDVNIDEEAQSHHGRQQGCQPGNLAAPADAEAVEPAVDAVNEMRRGFRISPTLPHVLVRLPYRSDGRSECGGPESPYFLKAWVHELGHALHYLASAAACDITAAAPLFLWPTAPSAPAPQPASQSALSSPPSLIPLERPQGQSRHPGPAADVNASTVSGDGSTSTGTPASCYEVSSSSASTGAAATAGGGYRGSRRRSGGKLALLSGAACPLDVREVPSHLLEHALRDPGCVRLLSRHGRLDCPLPQRDCARLVSHLSTRFTSTVGELQGLVATALADQLMHGAPQELPSAQPPPTPPLPSPSVPSPSPPPLHSSSHVRPAVHVVKVAADAASRGFARRSYLRAHAEVCSLTDHHLPESLGMGPEQQRAAVAAGEELRGKEEQCPDGERLSEGQTGLAEGAAQLASGRAPAHSPTPPPLLPPLLVPGPDRLQHLEALAVVGGGKYVYVASRLFAAAAWRKHLQGPLVQLSALLNEQPYEHLDEPFFGEELVQQDARRREVSLRADTGAGEDVSSDDEGRGASSDGFGGWVVRQILLEAGAHAPGIEMLRRLLGREAFVQYGSYGTGSDEQLRDGGSVGWEVDLGAEVFQDVDLLG